GLTSALLTADLAYRFPKAFLWGAATAAHQVEGGNHNNDWWQWEQLPGKIKNGDTSDPACDHYVRYRQDFETLRAMGHNAHRLSIEWSRLFSERGVVSPEAVAHYRQVLETLRELGMTPLVTLHHFTNPLWLSRVGGWENEGAIEDFRQLARLCAAEFGDLVDLWTTFNEPNVYAYQSYVLGLWPPERRDFAAAVGVMRNIIRAHAAAYIELKSGPHGGSARVGIAQHMRLFEPWRRWHPLDRMASALPEAGFNHWILRACTDGRAGWPLGKPMRIPEAAGTLDWIGLNYYSRDMVAFDATATRNLFSRTFSRPGSQLSDFAMEIYPQGIHTLLLELAARYGKPIYITENGVADSRDAFRAPALVAHLAESARALDAGADLRGYLHWSSMDNFEWAEGYTMRFGLLEVDFATQARVPRPSSLLYSGLIRRNGITWEELREYYPTALGYFETSIRSSASSSP
ncbi:MAG TPA: glycoside hydrolase family 1 protein, partial [Gemmatimonadales bacterium]|nr:glycoside hydrolase family 1 protein [Gemmatimonadales bacterium]